MPIDNQDLIIRLKKALDYLEKIDDGGETQRHVNKAIDKIEMVIKDLELMTDDGR